MQANLIFGARAWLCSALVFAAPAMAAPTVFNASGVDAAAVQPTVDAFRAALGALNANGPCAGFCTAGVGRREVNWDGVPDASASGGSDGFAGNFFNAAAGAATGRVRGIEFSSAGSLEVSARTGNPTGTATLFGNFNADNPAQFAAFSPERIFGLVNATTLDVTFSLPGSPGTAAVVRGFGAVFTDVEILGDTALDFFDAGGNLLLHVDVETFPFVNDSFKSFSFAGASWADPVVSRVRITAGSFDLSRTVGAGRDVVAMDDFIYAEPTLAAVVPEPGTGWLAALAIAALAAPAVSPMRRRRLGAPARGRSGG